MADFPCMSGQVLERGWHTVDFRVCQCLVEVLARIWEVVCQLGGVVPLPFRRFGVQTCKWRVNWDCQPHASEMESRWPKDTRTAPCSFGRQQMS